ncbi:hypothetical protein J2TS6_45020 [Paenibacillus albilobatus]|uniref:Uncharacterized protein n=1 Tax=Paenibacillus albilobatus TaxID=2716884 RepID=A0A919XJI2_9BACL|nr:hypothetical protein J2TS6_45020 [Paenibacillus albilobatus]
MGAEQFGLIGRGKEPGFKKGDMPIAGFGRFLSNIKVEMMKKISCYLYIYVNKYNFNWIMSGYERLFFRFST